MRSRPCSLPVVSPPPAPGCLSFPTLTRGRRILADGSCTNALRFPPAPVPRLAPGAAVPVQRQEGSGKASREGSQRRSHPGGRRPTSISHRTAQPHRGKDLAPRWLLSGAHGTHVRVAVPEEFVEDVAELPAEHRVARQRQPVHHRPEGLRPLLVVRAQDAWWWPVKETFLSPSAVMESGHPKAGWYPQSRGELGHRRELISCQAWVHIVPKGGTRCPLSSSPTPLLRERRGTLRTGAAPPLSLPGCPAGMLGIRFQRQRAHRHLWGLSILGPGRQPAAGILPPPHGTAAPGAHG